MVGQNDGISRLSDSIVMFFPIIIRKAIVLPSIL